MMETLSIASISAVAGVVALWFGLGEARLCSTGAGQDGRPGWTGAVWRIGFGIILLGFAAAMFVTVFRDMSAEKGTRAALERTGNLATGQERSSLGYRG